MPNPKSPPTPPMDANTIALSDYFSATAVKKRTDDSRGEISTYFPNSAATKRYSNTGYVPANEKISYGFVDGGANYMRQNGNPKAQREVIYTSADDYTEVAQAVYKTQDRLRNITDPQKKINVLLDIVNELMPDKSNANYQKILKRELGDPIANKPISLSRLLGIQAGDHNARSILFKVLAEEVGIPTALVRGEYASNSHAWNEVIIDGRKHIVDSQYTRIMDMQNPSVLSYTDQKKIKLYNNDHALSKNYWFKDNSTSKNKTAHQEYAQMYLDAIDEPTHKSIVESLNKKKIGFEYYVGGDGRVVLRTPYKNFPELGGSIALETPEPIRNGLDVIHDINKVTGVAKAQKGIVIAGTVIAIADLYNSLTNPESQYYQDQAAGDVSKIASNVKILSDIASLGAQLIPKIAAKAGPAAVVIHTAAEIAISYDYGDGNRAATAAGGAVGAVAGGIAGAKIGAAAGAAIGVWFGGVGAVPGAAIGAFIGGTALAIGGSFAGGKVSDFLIGKTIHNSELFQAKRTEKQNETIKNTHNELVNTIKAASLDQDINTEEKETIKKLADKMISLGVEMAIVTTNENSQAHIVYTDPKITKLVESKSR